MVLPITRNLLLKSYGIDKSTELNNIREIKGPSNYHSKWGNDLLDVEYIAYNQKLKVPIQFKIMIKKEKGKTILVTEINYYSFSGEKNIFNLKKIDLVIENKSTSRFGTSLQKFEIISPDSWLANNTSTNITTNQLYWKRQFDIVIECPVVYSSVGVYEQKYSLLATKLISRFLILGNSGIRCLLSLCI